MQILDGLAVSSYLKTVIKEEAQQLKSQKNKTPHLAALLVGHNPASEVYVHSKVKTCEELGFCSTLLRYEETISEAYLISEIQKLNLDASINGILVQLPLPKHINENNIINAINPMKDVDGFHPENQGKMVLGQKCFLPATPYGILLMLDYYKISVAGKNAVVVGRSNIVGTPMSILLSRNEKFGNATVTLAHSRTENIKSLCKNADILVAAIGKPQFITADMVKTGAIVIDVGINRIVDESRKSGYRLVGDVDFDQVAPQCSYITPVPKGVGPMTICGLMKNTLEATKLQIIE